MCDLSKRIADFVEITVIHISFKSKPQRARKYRTMQRVTSRQRLFSWDDFDASAPETDQDTVGDTSSQADSDYRSCLSVSYSHVGSDSLSAPKNAFIDANNGVDCSAPASFPDQAVRRQSQDEHEGTGMFGPCRSSSMLSLRQFSAHASFDEMDDGSDYSIEGIDTDDISCDLEESKGIISNEKDDLHYASISVLEVPSLTIDISEQQQSSKSAFRNNKRNADGMKKSVSFSTLPLATNMEPSAHTEMDSNLFSSISLQEMQQDVLIHCLSYLAWEDLRELSTTCHTFSNALITGTDDCNECIKNVVWWNIIRRQFPNLHLAHDEADDSTTLSPGNVNFIEHVHDGKEPINFPALLSISQPSPSTIDARHLKPTTTIVRRVAATPPIATLRMMGRGHNPSLRSTELTISSKPASFRKLVVDIQGDASNPGKVEVVQFVENVGAGDRSIVSDAPLPRPTPKVRMKHVMNAVGAYFSKAIEKHPKPFQPFVSPFVSSLGIRTQVDLTPRLMAYFEISILRNSEAQPTSSSCVAIGLSTRQFQSRGRMPGWDTFSFGYHGDDGGLFHSHGEMLRVYGPKFGVGDTIGCGVNYVNGGIFYTLNGDFLGYAWLNEQLVSEGRTDLFPTVGVDSKDFIAYNFGNESPFVFNFGRFVLSGGNMPLK